MTEYEQKVTRTLYWLTAASHRDALLSSSRGGTRIDWWPEYTLKPHACTQQTQLRRRGNKSCSRKWQTRVHMITFQISLPGFTCTGTRERSPGRSTGPDRWRSAATGRAHTAVLWSDTKHWWHCATSTGDETHGEKPDRCIETQSWSQFQPKLHQTFRSPTPPQCFLNVNVL